MNKLMLRHTMDKPLPYDAQIEWLACSTKNLSLRYAFVDTGIYPDVTTEVDFHYMVDTPLETPTNNTPWFGGRTSTNNSTFAWGVATPLDGQFRLWSRYGNYASIILNTYTLHPNFNINIKPDGTGTADFIITNHDDQSVHTYSVSTTFPSTSSRTIYIFTYNGGSAMAQYAHKFVDGKIWQNGQLVRDMIPVRIGNKGYIYDKVTATILTKGGNYDLICGPDYNPYAYQYLTFVPLEDSTFSFSKRGTGNDIEYSIDGGVWTALASEANTPTVGAGHNIRWRAELTPSTASGNRGIGIFSASGLYDVMGNTMSLLYGDNYIGQTTLVGTYIFCNLWQEDSHIYRADRMILPATTLATRCYYQMFYGCTSLTLAPELPAKTLSNYCYAYMFQNCVNLTAAPELPAETLTSRCYIEMFSGCKRLSYIKCLATDISAEASVYRWTSWVASTGTFVKHSQMTTLPTGSSGIPSGWTVVDDPSTINS